MVKNFIKFLSEVKAELKKVTWPNKATVIASTWAVIMASLLTSFYIFVVDGAVSFVMKFLV